MAICPNKSSKQWQDLKQGLREFLPNKSAVEIDALAEIAFIELGSGDIPSADSALSLLMRGNTKQYKDTVKLAVKSFKTAAESAKKDAFLAGQMVQGKEMAPKLRALQDKLENKEITIEEYEEEIANLQYEGMFKEAEGKLAAEIEGKKKGRAEGRKEQTAFQKEFSKKIMEQIEQSETLRSFLSPAQVRTIIRMSSTVGASEKALAKFVKYFENVVANANYANDLKVGKSLQDKLTKPFANAQDLINRMRSIDLSALSPESLIKFNAIAQMFVASKLPVTNPNYQPFNVSKAESIFKGIEEEAKMSYIKEVEDTYSVLGLTEEEAKLLEDFMASEDMDEFLKNINETKRKIVRDKLEAVAQYSLLGLKEYIARNERVLSKKFGEAFVNKLIKISDTDVKGIADNKQLAELIKTVDNIIVNNTRNSINNIYAIAVAVENNKKLEQITNPVIKFVVGKLRKVYYDTPIILQAIFGNTVIEGAIRRLTGLDTVINASTDAERITIGKVKEYVKYLKSLGLENTAITDVTIGVYADLINVKEGSEDSDFLNNKAQLEQSIELYKKSSDAEDVYIGQLLEDIYNQTVTNANTLDEFKNNYNTFHPQEIKAAEWVKKNVWDEYVDEFKRHAEENLNETFEADNRPNYQPRRYKKVRKTAESFDPFDVLFSTKSLKPKETGRSKERKLIDTLPKNKAVEYRFEFNTFKTLQEELYTSRSHLGAKIFHYMSENGDAMNNIFGGDVNAEFYIDNFKKQYTLLRFGKKDIDNIYTSTVMAATRIVKDLGSAIVLGRLSQVISQSVPLALTAVKNGKHLLDVITSRVPNDIELFNLAPIGSRGIEMGAAGRAEESEFLTYSKTKRNAEKVLSSINEISASARRLSLLALTNTDVYVAKKAFLSYYLDYMNNVAKIPTTADDLSTEHTRMNEQRELAISYAQQMVDKTQASSTRALQSEFKRNQNGSSFQEIVKNIVMPFNNFNANTKARIIEDGIKIAYGNNLQKREAAIDLAGSIVESATYQAINIFILSSIFRFGIKEVLKGAFDVEDDDDFYEQLSKSYKAFYTNVLRDLTVGGFGTGTEESGIKAINYIAYLLSEDAWSETGKDYFDWLRDEPTFQPPFTAPENPEFTTFDAIGAYGIPFEAAQKAYRNLSYAAKKEGESVTSYRGRVIKERGRDYPSNVSIRKVELTDEQQKFFLYLGLTQGLSAVSGLQFGDVLRASEKLGNRILRGERYRQHPPRRGSSAVKGIKVKGIGAGGIKTRGL
jgi:hypothetical protein